MTTLIAKGLSWAGFLTKRRQVCKCFGHLKLKKDVFLVLNCPLSHLLRWSMMPLRC
jgi:hypothetical protein